MTMLKTAVLVVMLALHESLSHNVARENDQHLRALLSLNEISNRFEGPCFGDIKSVLQLVLLEDENAMQMFNAWSAFPENQTHGNGYAFGDFDLCRTLRIDSVMRTRYCLVQYSYKSSQHVIPVQPNASFHNIQWRELHERFGGAICVPESCSASDVRRIVGAFFNGSVLVQADDYDQGNFCKGPGDEVNWAIIAVILLIHAILIPLVLAATYLDFRRSATSMSFKSPPLSQSLVDCFSIKKNFGDLMSDKSSIACLNGIKAISIFVIMLYHSIQFRLLFPFASGSQLSSWVDGTFMKFVGPLTIPVDAFLLVSGALATKCILRDLESGRFNIAKLYIQRYFRLTPVAIMIFIFSIFASELLYHLVPYAYKGDLNDACKTHWLTALLHVQIYTNPEELCVPYTWYLSVDWQMFLIAPLLIWLVWKLPHKKLIAGNFILLVSAFIFARFYVIVQHGFRPDDLAVYHSIKSPIEFLFYYPTHIRGLPFLIGMMLGFFLKDEKFSFGDKTLTRAIMGFSLVMSVTFILVYPIPLEHFSSQISPQFELFLFTFGKLLWSMAVAVVILNCHHGFGGVINRLLSLRVWSPIAKMSLSFYMMSAGITYILVVAQKQPQHIESGVRFALTYILDVSVSTTLAIAVFFLIEAPFIGIGRIVAKRLS